MTIQVTEECRQKSHVPCIKILFERKRFQGKIEIFERKKIFGKIVCIRRQIFRSLEHSGTEFSGKQKKKFRDTVLRKNVFRKMAG